MPNNTQPQQRPMPGQVYSNNTTQLNPQQINNIVAAQTANQMATQLAQQNAVTQRARSTVQKMRR